MILGIHKGMTGFRLLQGGKGPLKFSRTPHRGPRLHAADRVVDLYGAGVKLRDIRPLLAGRAGDPRLDLIEDDGSEYSHQVVPLNRANPSFEDTHYRRFGSGVLGLTHKGSIDSIGSNTAQPGYNHVLRFVTNNPAFLTFPQVDERLFSGWPPHVLNMARGLHLFVWLSQGWSGLDRVQIFNDDPIRPGFFENKQDEARLAGLIRNDETLFFQLQASGREYVFAVVGNSILPVAHSKSRINKIPIKERLPDQDLVIRGQRADRRFGSMVTIELTSDTQTLPLISGGQALMATVKKKPTRPFSDNVMALYDAVLEALGYDISESIPA